MTSAKTRANQRKAISGGAAEPPGPARPRLHWRSMESRSVVDHAAREIRRAVLSGVLSPGQPFAITDLSKQLGVSHIPVREALRQLEGDGLVRLRPGKTALVSPITEEDISELYSLREAIECRLVAAAARSYEAAEVAEISRHLTAMERQQGDLRGDDFWSAHYAFHWSLIAPAAGPWSGRLLDILWRASERYHRLLLLDPAPIRSAMTWHRQLAEEADHGNARTLERLLRDHLRENLNSLTDAIRSHGSDVYPTNSDPVG